jgi:hypothetical protein
VETGVGIINFINSELNDDERLGAENILKHKNQFPRISDDELIDYLILDSFLLKKIAAAKMLGFLKSSSSKLSENIFMELKSQDS